MLGGDFPQPQNFLKYVFFWFLLRLLMFFVQTASLAPGPLVLKPALCMRGIDEGNPYCIDQSLLHICLIHLKTCKQNN